MGRHGILRRNGLLEDALQYKPKITEVKDSPPPKFGNIEGSTGKITGIFFSSN